MVKTNKKLLAAFLCFVLVLCLFPVSAFAAVTEDINVYGETIWLVPPEGKIKSCEAAEIPEQYGEDNYPDASCLNITLTDVSDDESFTFNLRSDGRKGSMFLKLKNYISAVGFTYAQRDTLLWDDSFLTQIDESEQSLYTGSEKTYSIPVQLENGAAWVILYYYTYSQSEFAADEDVWQPPIALVLHFQKDGAGGTPPGPTGELEDDVLSKLVPEIGQLENENALYHAVPYKEYSEWYYTYLIVPNGTASVNATLTFTGNDYAVTVNGVEQGSISEDNKLTVTLNAGQMQSPTRPEYFKNEIKVSQGNKEKTYTVCVINQRFDDLPDAVIDYLCIGSQYTNGSYMQYGETGVRSLVGNNTEMGSIFSGPVSLGNFGGYITYYYADPITDNPNNPYGIDFITFGNSVEGSNEFGEVGQVWVSEDGETWYALAGGMHYEDYADWNCSVTYSKNSNGTTSWVVNGETLDSNYLYPETELYPWHTFNPGEDESITLSGIAFNSDGSVNEFGNIRPPFAGFGYTDMGQKGTRLPGETFQEYVLVNGSRVLTEEAYELLARNIGQNPYLPTQYNEEGRIFSNVTDGMDLAWAVDTEGQPVSFENGIHYVKIVTASNIVNGAIGEKSTEVNMVRVARANDAPVGKTDAPASITIDGAEVDITADTLSAVVDGPFKVVVDAPEDANVYINNQPAAEAQFDQIPLHQIVRVIVQEGEREPVIYVINLTETAEPSPTATLTLDACGGTVNGADVWSCRFDAQMAGDPLPEPVAPGVSYTFSGWYSGQKLYTGYPDEVQDITLVAHWTQTGQEPEPETIRVSFRLIGSTLADDEIDLADGDYHGAEYVTWIPTKSYTMHEGDTVADLIITACSRAGITQSDAARGYVRMVRAPAALGGYELAEFTNGPRSGWLYTIGGDHPNRGVKEMPLTDGDEVILHYADDYAWEVEDWSLIGGSGWPQQSGEDNNYWNAWLDCPDVAPSSGSDDPTPTPTPEPEAPAFDDVKDDDWFAEAVAYVAGKGIMTGTGERIFEPETPVSRGMLATILYRLEGKPAAEGENPFTDVKAGEWYTDAVVWAANSGIVKGYGDGTFGPDDDVTREQFATILYRYVQTKGGGFTGAWYFPLEFDDAASVSEWADEAMHWCVMNGIITGRTETTLVPGGNAKRAEAAMILMRFCEHFK